MGEGQARLKSGRLRIGGVILIGLAVLFIAAPFLLRMLPSGIPTGGAILEEGLLTVGDGQWETAKFDSVDELAENEALRSQGRFIEHLGCIDVPKSLRAELDRALAKAPVGDGGGRGAWVKIVTTRHFGANACIEQLNQHRSRRNRISAANYRRVEAVQAAAPIACDPFLYTILMRRCPAPPPPPKQLHLGEQSYPEDAARRGAEGKVGIVAIMGPKNELLDCKVSQSSGDAALDGAACGVFRDNAGTFAGRGSSEGLASGVRRIKTTISFEMEKSEPEPAQPRPDQPKPDQPRVKNRS